MVKSVQAEITSVSTAEGGNPKPLGRGYRAILHYVGDRETELHSVTVNPQTEFVEPGSCAFCEIRFLYPEYLDDRAARIGRRFELRDGAAVRATGWVRAVCSD